MVKLRFLVLLAGASLSMFACSRPWTVGVYNNDMEKSVGVRLRMSGEQRVWVLEPQQIDVLVQDPNRHPVTIELFDPANCNLLAEEALPDGPGVLVVVFRGVTGDGPWQVDAGIEDDLGSAVLEPNFGGCQLPN